MERRDFFKMSCGLCVALGAGALVSSLSSCSSSLAIYKTPSAGNKVNVPVSLFAESNLQIVRPEGYGYDIALRKESDGNYTALLMRCTHADNPVSSTGNGFECYLHGSKFNNEGAVTQGPASFPLDKLKAMVSGTEVSIVLR